MPHHQPGPPSCPVTDRCECSLTAPSPPAWMSPAPCPCAHVAWGPHGARRRPVPPLRRTAALNGTLERFARACQYTPRPRLGDSDFQALVVTDGRLYGADSNLERAATAPTCTHCRRRRHRRPGVVGEPLPRHLRRTGEQGDRRLLRALTHTQPRGTTPCSRTRYGKPPTRRTATCPMSKTRSAG